MSKQTAVQWLLEQWPILESQLPSSIINQALQMEQEQMAGMFISGSFNREKPFTFLEYYKEIYGGHLIDHIADVSKMVGGQDEK
jgi:hypothetical protein